MEIIDPQTGRAYFEKRRRRYNDADEPRELTFSCYQRYAFLNHNRTREWFCEALEKAGTKVGLQLWAYVIMPEHVHILVWPGAVLDTSQPSKLQGMTSQPLPSKSEGMLVKDAVISRFLQAVKEPVARTGLAYLRENAPEWLPRLKVKEGKRVRYRFWQPGGGYDRNVTCTETLRSMIEYIHANPVRRGLVAKAEEWEWSSARWFAGIQPVKVAMDRQVLLEL